MEKAKMTLRKRVRTVETPATLEQLNSEKTQSISKADEISGYEQFRDKRIKENMQRMQKLGIMDLSLKLKSEFLPPKRTPKNPTERKTHIRSPSPSSGPPRRSSRLQNVTPVSYSEARVKKEKLLGNGDDLVGEGKKPEIYTEEHEKLLGSCKTSWTLYVDGVGTDGNRIYDPIKGKTCHQCRQKTLGHRTHCSKCNLVQGQFCGDCLYVRYGENVLEANQNPNWICPVCRGICNCSLCRHAKGWCPTGSLYRKVSDLGYKSVAHYLFETRRSQTNSEGDTGTNYPASAKRSLPFVYMGELSEQKESFDANGHHGCSNPQSEENEDGYGLKGEKEEVQGSNNKHDGGNAASGCDPKFNMKPSSAIVPNRGSNVGRLRQMFTKDDCSCQYLESENNEDGKFERENEEGSPDSKHGISYIDLETQEELTLAETIQDSIAGRLRKRRNTNS